MSPYIATLKARFRMLLQYRAAAIAGFGTQVFWGFLKIAVLQAFYLSSISEQPMTLDQAITYTWLGQATLIMVLFRQDPDVVQMIRSGSVAYELLKPVDLYTFWYFRALAAATAPMVLRAIPIACLGGFFGMQAPADLSSATFWILSTIGAALLSSSLAVIMTISMLWTISGDGIARLLPAFVWILSGHIIPLPLFPDWMQPIFNVLPFRALADTPFRLYMGHISGIEAVYALAHQAIWILIIIFLGRLLLTQSRKSLVVQGG